MPWTEYLHAVIGENDGTITFFQMIARALIVFAVGLALVRLATPRIFSRATPIDIVLAVIIGSNLSRTLTGNAPFFPVIAATVVLVVLHAVLTRAAARWRPLANIVKGKPHVLVRNGTPDGDVMNQCAVGRRDLDAAIRAAGGTGIDDVKIATMERGGDIEVVLAD